MQKKFANLPLVVIAGRPNAGKSTLFNRLLRKRRAITSSVPGVTRDPVECVAELLGKPVLLVDTGGFKLERGGQDDGLDALVIQKAFEFIGRADVIVLVLEAGTITGEDEELIKKLRPHWDKVIAAVNKTEGGRLVDESWGAARFGFSELIHISAEHGDNVTALCEKIISRLDLSRVAEIDEEKPPVRIAVLGKPNTGKSTLANLLTHSERSIVSRKAGTTRDVVEGDFVYKSIPFLLMDTAGIRRRAKVSENVEYYSVNRAIKTLDSADIVFLLIDAEEGFSEQDKKIAALACEKGRGIIFALNKWDTQEQTKAYFKRTVEHIRFQFAHMEWAPILAVSAKTGSGIKELLETAVSLYAQLTTRIETSALNAALHDWTSAYPPPAGRSGHFSLRYIVQNSVNPARFILFASRTDAIPQTYLSYIKNKMRSDLGFDSIPVLLDVRQSRKKWEERQKK
ncbi:MAG: ribosome biogenesis GTPase Der [Treponemataceae bacterium]|nr:MAG: ribosome biogenesis GTPase Der [Treponemataceae bacterium]